MFLHPEYGLGEFALFEFANDGINYIEADLSAGGGADAAFSGGAGVPAALSAAGAATAAFVGFAPAGAVLQSSGAATVALHGGSGAAATLSAPGVGALNALATTVKLGEFSMTGASVVNMDVSGGEAFNIVGYSTVSFSTGASATARMNVAAGSIEDLQAVALSNSVMTSDGEALVSLDAGAISAGEMESDGAASLLLRTSAAASSLLTSTATGSLVARGSARASAAFSAAGLAVDALVGGYKEYRYSAFAAPGVSTTLLEGQFIRLALADMIVDCLSTVDMSGGSLSNGDLDAAGEAAVAFYRGRAHASSLPIAYDITIRPEELRSARWSE